MKSYVQLFEELIYDEMIVDFCSDENRKCNISTFNKSSVKVAEQDAMHFLTAWNGGLIKHVGRGLYRTQRSAAAEQFFWSGSKSSNPRSFNLWLEPIITVAALAKLHYDYSWPQNLIGTQSVDWAFDLVAFQSGSENEFIAGEVKKTKSEIEHLLILIEKFGRDPQLPLPPSGKERNAFKKVAGLRSRNAPIFWAVGPDGMSKVFRVIYHYDEVIELIPTTIKDLLYLGK